MNKLQAYYNYFDKYYGAENWDWYKSLSYWTDTSQKIKQAVVNTNFSSDDSKETLNQLEHIFKECSSTERPLNNMQDYCQQFLFESDNGVSTIRQQLLTNNRRVEIVKGFIDNPLLLIKILQATDVSNCEYLVRDIVKDNVNSVVFRFLRVLFPTELSAPDAPNRLNQRVRLINSKLGLNISGNDVEKHKQLMESIEADDIIKKQIFFWEIDTMLMNNLNLKKALIYYGAPGTGKTYKAKRVAKSFIDQHRIKLGQHGSNEYQIKTVQFHPSYSYEDFMEGIRPSADKSLMLFNGTFKAFCKAVGQKEALLYKDDAFRNNPSFKELNYNFSLIRVADLEPHQRKILGIENDLPEDITIEEVIEPAFFIVDEINRAELSRVFGELMYSLEYRGYTGKIKTQYSYLNKEEKADSTYFWENSEDWFFIPQNVYLIGTMNNIDRSVDSFDFALRRRFSWQEIQPDFNVVRNILTSSWKNDLAGAFEKLNKKIAKEELLGKDYRIGHAYALAILPIENRFETLNEVKKFVWNDFIKPLLEEYLRGLGNEQKSRDMLKIFSEAFGI